MDGVIIEYIINYKKCIILWQDIANNDCTLLLELYAWKRFRVTWSVDRFHEPLDECLCEFVHAIVNECVYCWSNVSDDDSAYMTADEMDAAKHKADMDDKMKGMIREILFYAFLLFFLLIVINGQQDTDSYRQNANIITTFNAELDDDVSSLSVIHNTPCLVEFIVCPMHCIAVLDRI